ncbi:ABC transporter permease [Insolitispirillum peregrinum]|uniref:ABC-2 type transport system permease protein n=1 Tax=Insolitispirillum peregrinum TaxID=80876 RepID=A0A1N7LA49_9PROT|nr:ABC transporter permease [Insolitispirillum peregrinum]SIS70641.1 ABC-2 type transport system permease protein [Insolitispirillum peregrinum]
MSLSPPSPHSGRASLRRTLALIRKESWQILRDPSAITIGVIMPIILLVLFGYGLSFDLKDLPVAIVADAPSADTADASAAFRLSPWFKVHPVATMPEAEQLMASGAVSAIVRFPASFSRDLARQQGTVQVVVNATDSNTARIAQSYATSAIALWQARARAEAGTSITIPSITLENRLWFNDANTSSWFLVPGLLVLVMTLIGALLTSSVIAREWERGTFEALFATPVRPHEILISKTVPYFVMGMLGLALSVIGSKLLFGVPLRGSLWLLVLISALYLVVSLGMGLVISAATRSQFLANQITILITFLPATMLSGFIFDIRSMPWPVQAITTLLPARYFVSSLQTLFLAGDVWPVILPDAAILTVMAVVFMALATRSTRKRLV